MIATLAGKVQSIHVDRAVIEIAGIGYEVFLSSDGVARLPEKGGEAFLYIHTYVREDAFMLFGFLEEQEKELFLMLKTVSGIGPKLSLAMLSGMRVGDICQAISEGDIKRLTTLQGVGKRTAERLCVELKEKVGHLSTGTMAVAGKAARVAVAGSVVADALSALANLGYADPVARDALASVKTRLGNEEFSALRVEEMIREGLKALV